MAARLTDQELLSILQMTDNASADRFIGMGFRLDGVQLYNRDFDMRKVIRVRFICLCGRTEMLEQIIDDYQFARVPVSVIAERFNVYRLVEQAGSLSRKHLLDDGYTESQIGEMELRLAKYMEDREVPFNVLPSDPIRQPRPELAINPALGVPSYALESPDRNNRPPKPERGVPGLVEAKDPPSKGRNDDPVRRRFEGIDFS